MTNDPDLVCILVHHRHFPFVLQTVTAIVETGVRPDRLLVVDNSEDPGVYEKLAAAVPVGVRVTSIPNRGYGNAVNAGLNIWQQLDITPEFVLVATHETRPLAGALSTMLAAMAVNPAAGVCGPTLLDKDAAGDVWSMGGARGRLTGVPIHIRREPPGAALLEIAQRDWLDGAFCLYRWRVLASTYMREDFLMYFEEVDAHLRMRQAGHDVIWVRNAVVVQSSSGTPSYLLSRNLGILLAAHGSPWHRLVGVPYAAARSLVRGRGAGRLRRSRELARGWCDGRQHVPARPGESWSGAEQLLRRVQIEHVR